MAAVDPALVDAFGLDPDIVHLNHGAFGVAPRVVREAAAAWRERAELNPHRFNRVELAGHVAHAREVAAGFLGVDPERAAWVRNVSEGVSAVLADLGLAPGDELVIGSHGYGAVRIALEHVAARSGARVITAPLAVGDDDETIVEAYAAATGPRTRLVVVDQITSPSALVLPVAAICAAVEAPVLVDAAHVPGHLQAGPGTGVEQLGATYWVGNLHKWAYTPRGSAILWTAPGHDLVPGVKSWDLEAGQAHAFDHPGTWDYAGWLAVPDGLGFWAELGGWDRVAEMSRTVHAGQKRVADALGTSLDGLPDQTSTAMCLVRLPERTLRDDADVEALYERLSARGVEAVPVRPDGDSFMRLAAGPYNTVEDFDRLADVLLQVLA